MVKSNEYWKERFEQLELAQLEKGEKYFEDLDKIYRQSINEIESKIARWYARIAKNNDIGMAEARKWLKGKELEEFKWSVEEYIQHGKQNAINGNWLKELENASARVHISRLEALEIQLRQTVEELYQKQTSGLSDTLKTIYEDRYYHSAFEIQRGLNVGWTIPALDTNQISKVLSKPWTRDGKTFSNSIWKAKDDLVKLLHTELTQSIILGKSPDKLISKIVEKLGDTNKKGFRYRAGRLVMTESAFFSSASQKDCFNDLGVEEYQICATLDNRTSETCQELDGKVFKMSEYEPGLTAPPFHCWCRTTTIPYFEDNFGERIARDESGRQYYVPDNMTYKEWKKEYVKNSISNSLKSGIIQSDEDIRKHIKSDNIVKILNKGAQQKHVKSNSRYIEGRSYLTISEEEAQDLVNKYAGTGTLEFDRKGQFKNKELIVIDKSIGININNLDSEETETNKFYIHYGKKGTHIVPTLKGVDKDE